MNRIIALLEQYGLLSLEKQNKFSSLAGDHFLELDLDGGIARFTGGLECPFQVLGTESDNSLTWLWAWAEEQTEIPEGLLRSSRELQQWGEGKDLAEFRLPSVDLDRLDGMAAGAIAAAVCKASCFYRDRYAGGSLVILLFSSAVDQQPDLDRAGLLRSLADLADRYEVDPRKTLVSYFRAKGLPCSEAGGVVNAQTANGERVVAEFSADGGLERINGEPWP